MTSKEIVLRAIERRQPPRLPVIHHNRDLEMSDVRNSGYGAPAGFKPARPGVSEWGYVWHSYDQTMGQPTELPLADWKRIETYVAPDPFAPGRFEGVLPYLEANRDRFLKAGLGISGFNQATFLRGFEPFLMDLTMDRARAERVLDLVFNFENGIIEQFCQQPVDAVSFADDWGTQQGLMISPALWREAFRPRYAQQFARIHRAGKKVWFHSCGNVYAILGDLIEIGADVLELLQPDLLGVERLAADFGGRVCFCCSVDHQRRAISGTRDEIYAYARRLNEQLGRFNGGLIGYVEDYACLGMSDQNYQWVRDAFHNRT